MSVTPYRVSTITTNGSVGAELIVNAVFHGVPILPVGSEGDGFLFAEIMINKVIYQRGKNPREATRRRASASTASPGSGGEGTATATSGVSRFINQTTVVYRYGAMTPNIKIFANGNLHMTGVKDVASGSAIVDRLIEALRAIPGGATLYADATLKNQKYIVRMINVDFKLDGWGINRDKLFATLDASSKLKLVYEANTYQALKVHYYFNESKHVQNGCCECHAASDPTRKCEGKGNGQIAKDCKRVTLTIFGTGKMMIIGASSMAQVDHVHAFAQRMLAEHVEAVRVPLRV